MKIFKIFLMFITINLIFINCTDKKKPLLDHISNTPTNGTVIKTGEFKDQKLLEIFVISPDVKIIETGAFEGAELPAGFKIPNSVTKIESDAFKDVKLPKGHLWSGNKNNDSDYIPKSGDKVVVVELPEKFKTEGKTVIKTGEFKDQILPVNFLIASSVIKIEKGAFEGATFEGKLIIPSSVTIIEGEKERIKGAFSNTTFEENLIIRAKITIIEANMFDNATFEKDVLFETNTIETVGIGAFLNVVFKGKIKLPSTIMKLKAAAFAYTYKNNKRPGLPLGFKIPQNADFTIPTFSNALAPDRKWSGNKNDDIAYSPKKGDEVIVKRSS